MKSWDNVICVAEKSHARLQRGYAFFRRVGLFSGAANIVLVLVLAGLLVYSHRQTMALLDTRRELHTLHKNYERSGVALAALARSHEDVLDAKEQLGSVGEKSWGRRFVVTKYVPSAGGINADSDPTTTASMWKADPKLRIVAVDPKLIPINSYVWVEGLGWYHAQDVGGAIKGFRLDVMEKSLRDATKWGKQERFAIVIPPSSEKGSDVYGSLPSVNQNPNRESGTAFAIAGR